MTVYNKTDNHDPNAKLNLRRYFLNKYYNSGNASVLDCCMGSGFLWGVLKKEYKIESYLGLDMKQKKGRLKIDSARYLESGKWDHNVIDVDTYGSPWRHWFSILKAQPEACTVFLTIGLIKMGGGGMMSKEAKKALNIPKLTPVSILGKLHELSINYCLAGCYKHDMIIEDAVEAESTGNARYIGVRIKRREDNESDI